MKKLTILAMPLFLACGDVPAEEDEVTEIIASEDGAEEECIGYWEFDPHELLRAHRCEEYAKEHLEQQHFECIGSTVPLDRYSRNNVAILESTKNSCENLSYFRGIPSEDCILGLRDLSCDALRYATFPNGYGVCGGDMSIDEWGGADPKTYGSDPFPDG